MKILICLIALLMSLNLFADSVKVEVSPSRPVAGEVFQAIFRVFTESEEEPSINFTPFRVEVVGKNNQGIKTSTLYANGKFTSTREMTIVYDLAATSTGTAGLRDITVQVNGKSIRHPAVTFNVLKEPEVAADVFVMAEVPKTTVFVGEGIVVRYFLYHKTPVRNVDIKKYPKLNGFLKRFLQEPERSERVSVDGQLYIRTQLYAAKLFPEKMGELKIDPLQLSATITISQSGDPFGTFGFGGTTKLRTIQSETIKLEVRPLPEAGRTEAFTGLVGKHEFDLQVNNAKLIVNEPLEVKLTVSGNGALENLEAPTLIKHQDLEEFESNGDLKIMDADQATKVFDYTYLPKANMSIPATFVNLSYFDPDTSRYETVQLPMPEIVVAGASQKAERQKPKEQETKSDTSVKIPQMPKEMAGPILAHASAWRNWLSYVNGGLALLASIIALSLVFKRDKLPSFSSTTIPSRFKKGEFELSEFVKWVSPLIAKTGKGPMALIKESDLSSYAKTYFIDLLKSNDYKDYAHTKGQLKYTYNSQCFKELDKYIQSVTNENPSQPS